MAPNLEDLLDCVSSKETWTGMTPQDRFNVIKSLCFESRRNKGLAAYAEFANTDSHVFPNVTLLALEIPLEAIVKKIFGGHGTTYATAILCTTLSV